MKIRTWFKKTQIGRVVWRVIIGAIGGLITVFGAIALVGPGPGILIVLAGLGILAISTPPVGSGNCPHLSVKRARISGSCSWLTLALTSVRSA